jgi:hypothetical protein
MSTRIRRIASAAAAKKCPRESQCWALSNNSQTNVVPRWSSSNGAAQSLTSVSATNKQVQYLLNLGRQKGLSKADLESHVADFLNHEQVKSVYELSKTEAANAIDQLLNAK